MVWHDVLSGYTLTVATPLSARVLLAAHRLSYTLSSPGDLLARAALITVHLGLGTTLVLQVLTPGWRSLYRTVRTAVSHRLDTAADSPAVSFDGARVQFRNTEFSLARPKPGAPHADAAALRNSVSQFARNVALSLGATVHIDQMSAGDQNRGFGGSRRYFWPTDVKISARDDARPSRCLDVLIDSDYYDEDLPKRLARNFSPTLVYTFVPETAGASSAGFSYGFQPDGCVEYVNDSKTFKHRLHDWSGDVITISDGPPWDRVFAVFSVDRRRVAPCRAIIALIPLRRWHGPMAFLAAAALDSAPLGWLDPRVGKWAVVSNRSQEIDCVSIAALGQRSSATVPRSVWDAIAIEHTRTAGKKLAFQKALVMSQLPPGLDYGGVMRDHVAAVLTAFFEDTGAKPGTRVAQVQMTELTPGVLAHQPAHRYDHQAKCGLKQFANPLAMASFAPAQTRGNEERSIKGRIQDIANNQTACTPFLSRIMDEFMSLVVPDHLIATGSPVEPGEVAERQSRPGQIRIIEESDLLGESYQGIIKCFMKNEAQQKPGDPRNISTLPGKIKVGYSGVMYAFADAILCKHTFIACAISPFTIAERVASLSTLGGDKDVVLCADMSRMDGHESYPMRRMMEGIFYRFFHPCYHGELAKLMAAQHSQPGRTRFGFTFDTGASRLSGSPETSAWNTLEMAFMLYLTMRMTKVDGAYTSPDEAWARLNRDCLVLGDDSIFGTHSSQAPRETFLRATQMCLHSATVDVCEPGGSVPVMFLSRVYSPWVYYGANSSMCCIRRAVQKWHTCTVLEPGTEGCLKKLVEKSLSILCSDSATPILGPLSVRALELASLVPGAVPKTGDRFTTSNAPELGSLYTGDTSWWARKWGPNPLVAYPNIEHEGWMMAELGRDLPGFDLDKFHDALYTAKSWEQLLRLPCCWAGERDVIPDALPQETIVGDYVVPAKPKKGSKVPPPAAAGIDPQKTLGAEPRAFLKLKAAQDEGSSSDTSRVTKSGSTPGRRRRGRRTTRKPKIQEHDSSTEPTSGGDSITAPSGP